ncbi:MAG: SGNH/GDSL hydrolase family protein [Cytophagales bacterium]|nr:SGNH/GDSL hydrolase family protein [Rhizobacter sp.]
MTSSLKSKLLSTGVAVVAILVSILLAEGAARLVVDPADFLIVVPVSDPFLGHKVVPGDGGHDALGFRNRAVPKTAQIVAIGDSMTYGSGAPRDGAWPQQLATLGGESVYNMGLGGYGPLQYLQLASTQAKQFKPRQLIVGFYFGNDFIDAYMAPQSLAHWQSWRESVAAPNTAPTQTAGAKPAPQRRGAALRNWLSRHSVLYGMLRTTVLEPFAAAEQKNVASQMSPDERLSWSDPAAPEVKTVFTAQQRGSAQDTSQSNVREGMQITKRAFAAIKDEADKQGVGLLVVLIPTRERVYCPYLKATGTTLPHAYMKLCQVEDANKAELIQALNAKAIAYVDPTAAMEAKVEQHVQIYPPTSDGHPTALGHRAIAEAVLAALKKLPAAAAASAPK